MASYAPQGPIAVVVGSGVSGLLAAHVACKHFDRVFLVEGDTLQPASTARGAEAQLEGAKQHRGIPQYMQPHTLASGGLEAMEQLLPGFHEELVREGGVPLDLANDLRFFDFGGPNVRCPSSLKSVGASRHLIQSTLQDEVARRNGGRLTIRNGCRVHGLLWSEDKSSVAGVELASGEALPTDVVIMACGRFSRLPHWLAAAGYAVPPVQKVDSQLTYVGRLYQIPEDWEGEWKGHITYGRPNGLRGAGMVPVGDGIWQMAVWGINGVLPPTDEAGFQQFAASLPDPEIYKAIQRAKPLTPLAKFGWACNIQRSWHKVALPAGLLVIGDAVQALNPVYAQGMSVAAKSAVALDASLAKAAAGAGAAGSAEARRAALRGVGPAFQRRLAAVIAPAWQLATAEDMRYPGTKSEGVARPPRLLTAYIDTLFHACHRDGKVIDILFSVAHMVRPPHHLFHPHLLAAAALEALRHVLELLSSLLASLLPSTSRSSGSSSKVKRME